MDATPNGPGEAAERYKKLAAFREPYLKDAYDCAAVTLPGAFPRSTGAHGADRNALPETLPMPNQELGARGVNNLGAKIMLALFPANGDPTLRYVMDPAILTEEGDEEIAEVQQLLSEREMLITNDIEASKYRPKLVQGVTQLIVAGNGLIHFPDAGGLRVFRMDRYVVKRDAMGVPIEIILMETLDPATMPEAIKAQHAAAVEAQELKPDEEIEVYTHIKRMGDQYHGYQEVLGQTAPGSAFSYPADAPLWLPLAINRVDGEDWGHGYVYEYLGGLSIHNTLEGALAEHAVMAARVLFFLDPNADVTPDEIEEAPNGTVLSGRAEQVTTMRIEKMNDMTSAEHQSSKLASSLAFAFLLNSAIRRDAERVTREEIREVARELEDTLGGIYAVLAEELQLPIVLAHERRLERDGRLARIDKKYARPVIVTGLEAIGRSHDLVKLQAALADLQGLAAIDPNVPRYIQVIEFIERIFTARGMSIEGLIRKAEEVQAEIQQEKQAAAMQQGISDLGPEALRQLGQQPAPA